MSRTRSITYWTTTGILAAGLLGSGIQQLLRTEAEGAVAPPYAWGIVQLGYPTYLLTIIGVWKILGAIAIVIPSRPLTKEWAYAGITFLLTGAIVSHLAVGHSWLELLPAVMLLALTAASWMPAAELATHRRSGGTTARTAGHH